MECQIRGCRRLHYFFDGSETVRFEGIGGIKDKPVPRGVKAKGIGGCYPFKSERTHHRLHLRPSVILPQQQMSSSPFTAQTKEEALSQYTQLSQSPNPNDKLLALGGLIRFIQDADRTFLLHCAKATDYNFLDKMIRNGMSVSN